MSLNSILHNSRKDSLNYHEYPSPGKISISPTKQIINQRDLSLAYSPGVSFACEEIIKNPLNSLRFTSKGNLVGVITNGTAVLGLGQIGPAASKPVMEGKAVLFKKFAGIDVFDIEINELNPEKLINIIVALEPTFGGINLEDIKAPDCFVIERECKKRMNIPVFHDDQHGTAIVVAAAIKNAMKILEKNISNVKLVTSGAGAAALACLDLLIDIGLSSDNIIMTDLAGVVYHGRSELMDSEKKRFACKTSIRTLSVAMQGADIFLGLSAGGVLKQDYIKEMAPNPLILALANPIPEIFPELALMTRPDAIIATGRTDYPNQVNNVLCFPFIFRGALDAGATMINRKMELAAVNAIADLAHQECSDIVAMAYGIKNLSFGSEYIIPKPFDPRLISKISPAVAKAAIDSGVATRQIENIDNYTESLQKFVYHSSTMMNPFFHLARKIELSKKRIVFTNGEEIKTLRAVQIIVDEKLANPILIGRSEIIKNKIVHNGLRLRLNYDYTIIDVENKNSCYDDFYKTYYEIMGSNGVNKSITKFEIKNNTTLIGLILLKKEQADGMICGYIDTLDKHLYFINQIIGSYNNCNTYAAMSVLILPERQIFLVDTHININPTAEELAKITIMANNEVNRFGVKAKIALISHSNFGSSNSSSANKMRRVIKILKNKAPNLNIDGEMNGDIALNSNLRKLISPKSTLKEDANLLIFPNIDSANISYNLLKIIAGNNVSIGPIILGTSKPVHILNSTTTVRGIINMTSLLVTNILTLKTRL